ncbi:hypothetical protein M5689_001153 [Euphorbia peplus]|nr:hypothetical protein M5689_001153 [Euphorbia peplus]
MASLNCFNVCFFLLSSLSIINVSTAGRYLLQVPGLPVPDLPGPDLPKPSDALPSIPRPSDLLPGSNSNSKPSDRINPLNPLDLPLFNPKSLPNPFDPSYRGDNLPNPFNLMPDPQKLMQQLTNFPKQTMMPGRTK